MRISIFGLGLACTTLAVCSEATSLKQSQNQDSQIRFSQVGSSEIPESEMKTMSPKTDESMVGPAAQDASTINLVENERNMHLLPDPRAPLLGQATS